MCIGRQARATVPRMLSRLFLFALICLLLPRPGGAAADPASYLVGSGIYDITGPPAGVMMQGYVKTEQTTHGIHMRLRSRAFVVAEPATGKRVALASIDQIHVYQGVTRKVVEKLRATFGDLYTDQNVHIAATHTHSAPGGYSHHFLYTVSTMGFAPENFEAVVEGVYQSIVRAHRNLEPGRIRVNRGDLLGASVNRSLEAYVLNPADERARYAYDTDKEMTVLRFERADGGELGALVWFPVHATSMQADNLLISGDNKGYASWLFERAKGTRYDAEKTFVASFPNSNAGDVSPSIGADLTGDRQWDCDRIDSYLCAEQSGTRQYERARALYETATEVLAGPVDFRHTYLDFSRIEVEPGFADGQARKTCYAGIGISMLAGAKDGIGVGKQGRTCTHPGPFTRAMCATHPCHEEKPVVLATGRFNPPWTPEVLPVQLIRIGQLALVAVPGEFTTMAGRRMRGTVLEALGRVGVNQAVLAGYANAYAGYVATREEYRRQNYEGASTHFGPWTLGAWQQEMHRLALAMRAGSPVPAGLTPRDLSKRQWITTPRGHHHDRAPLGKAFGALKQDAGERYRRGEVVEVRFWGANPDRDLLTQGSYLEVQRETTDGWTAVAWDWDPETKFRWRPKAFSKSLITIEWSIPKTAQAGRYRILHRGRAKGWGDPITPYEGLSRVFEVE